MKNEEAGRMLRELEIIQSEMSNHATAVRSINARLTAARDQRENIPKRDVSQIVEDIRRHLIGFQQAAMKGVGIYQRLRACGFGTPQLDDWEKRAMEALGPVQSVDGNTSPLNS